MTAPTDTKPARYDSQLARKEIACSFLRLASSGRIGEAFEGCASQKFVHHNPHFKGNAESLRKGMAENAAQFPGKVLEIQRALEEGDLVAVHSRVRLKPGEPGMALVHIFRFEDDRIVELWDVGQPVPEHSINECGMF